jgi:hypothetical protein
LITATVEEGRALAIALARHSIQAMQHDEDVLKTGRAQPTIRTRPSPGASTFQSSRVGV